MAQHRTTHRRPTIYLIEQPARTAWRLRRRTVTAGAAVAVFALLMFIAGATWPSASGMAFAATIGAIIGAHHWDKHRRPDPDDIDVISCFVGVYLAGVAVAAVAAILLFIAYELLT